MAFMMLLAAWFLGMDAADKLNSRNPMPVAWFEAAICAVLIVGAVVLIALGRDD